VDSAKIEEGFFASYHKVSRGETFEFIAQKHSVEVDSLASWNQLATNARLFLGQNLILYTKQAPVIEEKPEPKPETPSQAPAQYHTVRSGETLWGVARKYNTSPEAIKAKNGLKSDGLRVGQRLKIK
jgi:membrane-bound lytic murein transglycosylase D